MLSVMYPSHVRRVVGVQRITHALCVSTNAYGRTGVEQQGSRGEALGGGGHDPPKLLHGHRVGSGSYEA